MEINENWPTRKSLEVAMPKKFRKEVIRTTESVPINWAMLFLCVGSLGISGIFAYRELQLEARLASLETRCDRQETSEVIIKRLRREVQEAFLGQKISHPDNGIFRIKRDVPECNCPPGQFL
ncbi:hypothetical protein PV326_002467 [Microctonus aethiopoides]|nr:hypothetical protein PV326_002467 [Microctonus aethiopoides]